MCMNMQKEKKKDWKFTIRDATSAKSLTHATLNRGAQARATGSATAVCVHAMRTKHYDERKRKCHSATQPQARSGSMRRTLPAE